MQQFVGSQQIAAKICRDEKQTDDDSRDNVTKHNLQVSKVAALFRLRVVGKGERRHSDQRERAGFRRHDREADHDPGSVLVAEKVILNSALRFAKHHAKDRDTGEIKQQHDVIDCGESHPMLCTQFRCGTCPAKSNERTSPLSKHKSRITFYLRASIALETTSFDALSASSASAGVVPVLLITKASG